MSNDNSQNTNKPQPKNPVDRAFSKITDKAVQEIDKKIDTKVEDYIKTKKLLDAILSEITDLESEKQAIVEENKALRKGISV